jgi:hypothetical protein
MDATEQIQSWLALAHDMVDDPGALNDCVVRDMREGGFVLAAAFRLHAMPEYDVRTAVIDIGNEWSAGESGHDRAILAGLALSCTAVLPYVLGSVTPIDSALRAGYLFPISNAETPVNACIASVLRANADPIARDAARIIIGLADNEIAARASVTPGATPGAIQGAIPGAILGAILGLDVDVIASRASVTPGVLGAILGVIAAAAGPVSLVLELVESDMIDPEIALLFVLNKLVRKQFTAGDVDGGLYNIAQQLAAAISRGAPKKSAPVLVLPPLII